MPAPINRMDAGDPIAEPRETPGASGVQWIPTKKFWRWLAAIQAAVQSGGGGGGGTATPVFQTLTGATTAINAPTAPTADGQWLIVEILQDATGARQITWGTFIDPATPVGLNFDPNGRTAFTFYGKLLPSPLWYLSSQYLAA